MGIIEEVMKNGKRGILVLGSHPALIQSILDFDYLSGRAPSVLGIITAERKAEKYFFGKKEIMVPCFKDVKRVPEKIGKDIFWMLSVQSGRRAREGAIAFFDAFPHALGGHIFAENVPEAHATDLISRFHGKKMLVGPSGVGFLVPGVLKLGAIGGIDPEQIVKGRLTERGSVAVFSTSGGMTNEFMRAVVGTGRGLSFAAAIGGDRFPVTSLTELFLLAQADRATEAVVYFGELGGADEYEIVELMKAGKFKKPLVAYIAGTIDESFDDHVQFGHAKALVAHADESARAKRAALKKAGAIVPGNYRAFLKDLNKIGKKQDMKKQKTAESLEGRQKSILSTYAYHGDERISSPVKGKKLVKKSESPFVKASLEVLLQKKIRSAVTLTFAETLFTLLIDHGGHVSGAVNTMVTARAGKDMVSSLASGLLTIGPRFGGAVNAAADAWLTGVAAREGAKAFADGKNARRELIPGIGHKKYRVGLPDPRVALLLSFLPLLKKHPHVDFAKEIEEITTAKNGSLILNVDGAMAALFLDILKECEGMGDAELQELVSAEFFNVFFVIPRTVGFIGHFLEQKRHDEGLFRLPDNLLFERED